VLLELVIGCAHLILAKLPLYLSLAFGSTIPPCPHQHRPASQAEIEYSNGCAASDDVIECRRVYNGIMTKGLKAAFEQFTSLAEEVIASRLHAIQRGTDGPVAVRVSNPNWLQLRQLSQYMRAAFVAISSARQGELKSIDSAFAKLSLYSTVGISN
jgi:hypothetical protein